MPTLRVFYVDKSHPLHSSNRNKKHENFLEQKEILDDDAISSTISSASSSSSGSASLVLSYKTNLSPTVQAFIKEISCNIPSSSLSSLLLYSTEDEAQENTDELSGMLFDHIDKLPPSSIVRRELSFGNNGVDNDIIDATAYERNAQEYVGIDNIDDSILLECMNALINNLVQRWEFEQAHRTTILQQDYDTLISELSLSELGHKYL